MYENVLRKYINIQIIFGTTHGDVAQMVERSLSM
jgi:hypothetical protein